MTPTTLRDADRERHTDEHVLAPYRGQGSERDFRRLKADPLFLFEDAPPDLYRAPRRSILPIERTSS